MTPEEIFAQMTVDELMIMKGKADSFDRMRDDVKRWAKVIERQLNDGSLSLADAVYSWLHLTENHDLSERWVEALCDYDVGGELADTLGIAQSKTHRRRMKKHWRDHEIVERIDKSPLRKVNPNYYPDTAFHEIGKDMGLKASYVHDVYYSQRKILKKP